MKVLRVAQTCYPDVAGGGAYHVHALSRDQAAMGHDVTVLTVRRDPRRPHLERRAGYAVVRFDPAIGVLGNELAPGVARYLREADGFDVLHAHSHLYASTNLAAVERRLGDVPLAITNHGLYSQTAPKPVFDAYLRTLGRWTFDQADVVFCYTRVDAGRLRAVGVETDVTVVPNGIDTDRFTPEGPTSDRIDGDGAAILFVGRLVPGKRPRDAIAAVDRLREDHPGVTLYVAGDGPLGDELDPTAGSNHPDAESDGGPGGVAFLGRVPYDEMPALYRSADALVLPSRAEGLPRTVLEAMASGTPVVTSDLPHVRPVATRYGTTAPVGAVPALARGLASVLADPPDGGPAYVRREHRWADCVDATTEALERRRRAHAN